MTLHKAHEMQHSKLAQNTANDIKAMRIRKPLIIRKEAFETDLYTDSIRYFANIACQFPPFLKSRHRQTKEDEKIKTQMQ